MAIRERLVEYKDGEAVLEGFFCWDEARPGPLPAVVICHAWAGRDAFVEGKARRLAAHGYAAFALDVYGKGRRGATREECSALMSPFVHDRALLARRLEAALGAVRALAEVDGRRVAAMGFCFGGLCVLDLARNGADLRGVASFHGLLKPRPQPSAAIRAKVLVLHGHDDPMVPVEDVVAFEREMSKAGADWQLHVYGRAMHAFTNPEANDPGFGTVYEENADRRSWKTLIGFLEEVLR